MNTPILLIVFVLVSRVAKTIIPYTVVLNEKSMEGVCITYVFKKRERE